MHHRSGLVLSICMVLWSILLCSPSLLANSLSDTQKRLTQLEKKIQRLDHNLKAKKNKENILNQRLAHTEKAIGAQIHQLQMLCTKLQAVSVEIQKSKQSIQALIDKQSKQQDWLCHHVQSRYKIDNGQPLKWFINQAKPESLSRTLQYYRYLIASRKQLLDALQATKVSRMKEQALLTKQQLSMQSIQTSMAVKQKELHEDKAYQTALLHRLQKEIVHHQNTKETLQNNQRSLRDLIQRLQQKTVRPPTRAFSSMIHKLPLPVHQKPSHVTPLNQGLLFSAPEGAVVHAVFPGTVIFSDWLKGYGLLLILDHGQGYLTLYAHNQSLFKESGERVLNGEAIAKVGHSGGLRKNGLYFEVRYRGKALPAQKWLQ